MYALGMKVRFVEALELKREGGIDAGSNDDGRFTSIFAR
jgi:hypothetical protein